MNNDYDILNKIFEYDPITGLFIYKVKPCAWLNIGDPAGTLIEKGYWSLTYKRKRYRAHRVAWLLYYKKWPDGIIDHIDTDKLNNKIDNLRDIEGNKNQQNQRFPSKNNTTGYLGVSFDRSRNKYMANIMINRKAKNLGRFNSPEEAYNKYIEAKRILHEYGTL